MMTVLPSWQFLDCSGSSSSSSMTLHDYSTRRPLAPLCIRLQVTTLGKLTKQERREHMERQKAAKHAEAEDTLDHSRLDSTQLSAQLEVRR